MELNPTHWGRPSMPCTLWMSPKGKLHTGNASTEHPPARGSSWLSALCCLCARTDCCSLRPRLSAAVTCWTCTLFYLPRVMGRGVTYLDEVHHCPVMRPSPNLCCKQQAPSAFGSLGAGRQHRSPWRLSRTEESICSQKCRFPWEGHVWQFKGESFVGKTADFRSIKAFKMDRSTWHTKQEAFGSSVTPGALDTSNTPLLAGFASPQQMVLHVLSASLSQM